MKSGQRGRRRAADVPVRSSPAVRPGPIPTPAMRRRGEATRPGTASGRVEGRRGHAGPRGIGPGPPPSLSALGRRRDRGHIEEARPPVPCRRCETHLEDVVKYIKQANSGRTTPALPLRINRLQEAIAMQSTVSLAGGVRCGGLAGLRQLGLAYTSGWGDDHLQAAGAECAVKGGPSTCPIGGIGGPGSAGWGGPVRQGRARLPQPFRGGPSALVGPTRGRYGAKE